MFVFQSSKLLFSTAHLYYFARSSLAKNSDLVQQFHEIFPILANGQKYERLRLPLQCATLIGSVFLLGGLQLHKAKPFFHRYRLLMVYISFNDTNRIAHIASDNSISVFQVPRQQTPSIIGSSRKCYMEGNFRHSMRCDQRLRRGPIDRPSNP